MRLTALVPVKPPIEAKERLAAILSPAERADLARITFRTVATALFDADIPSVVLTPHAVWAAEFAGRRLAVLEEDPARRSLSAQLEGALDGATFAGSDAVLILHADLPLASAAAIRRLVSAAKENPAGVTMVESADGGTNAMILPFPPSFALQYGQRSFARHSEAAGAAGLSITRHESAELILDLDTAADIRTLLQSPEGRNSAAGQFLLARAVESRLTGGP